MFFVAKICKRALHASIEGNFAVAASTPTYSSLVIMQTRSIICRFPSLVSEKGSEIVPGTFQLNSYLSLSDPLVVLLRMSRGECSCSGPSAGIIRIHDIHNHATDEL